MEEEKIPGNALDIKVLPSEAQHHKCPDMMRKIGLCHPFSATISGASGSGKTTFCLNLLTRGDSMYGNYFDEIHLFSLTARSDSTWKILKLKDEFIHDKAEKLISDLRVLLSKQKSDVDKRGVLKVKKLCLVFDDVSANRKMLNSSEYMKAYVQNRHYAISTIAMVHKYHIQRRICRLNSNHLFIFPATENEIQKIMSETQPAGISKREYHDIIEYCFTPQGNDHPFMWLNFKVSPDIRIRRNLTEIIRIK